MPDTDSITDVFTTNRGAGVRGRHPFKHQIMEIVRAIFAGWGATTVSTQQTRDVQPMLV